MKTNLSITQCDIDHIHPYPGNPRKTEAAVEPVARSIREFGFRQPIVVDAEHVIVVGHVRYQAALSLGIKKVPVHVAKDLTPAQARAYRLADNKTNEYSEWDFELLEQEMSALQAEEFDLECIGFSAEELDGMLQLVAGDAEGESEIDDIPEPPDDAVSVRGEVYILGQHRLMCGDSSSPGDLDILLAGNVIHLVNTDPPYNVKVEPRSNNAIAAGLGSFGSIKGAHHQGMDLALHPEKAKRTTKKLRAKDRPLANDFMPPEEFDKILMAWFGNIARVLQPGRAFYIWGGYVNCGNYPSPLKHHGLYFSQAIIWVKEHPVLTRKDFMGNHEWCFYGWREGSAHQFFGPNNATDVWSVKKVPSQRMVHLTEKPVELAQRAMEYSSKPGENVLDLFGGSGSTLMAAEVSGRVAFLMELDPLYCDVIRQRWATHVHGEKADWVALTPSTKRAGNFEMN